MNDELKDNTYTTLGKQARSIRRRNAAADWAQIAGSFVLILALATLVALALSNHTINQRVARQERELEFALCQSGIATPDLAKTRACKQAAAIAAARQSAALRGFVETINAGICNRTRGILIAEGFKVTTCPNLRVLKAPIAPRPLVKIIQPTRTVVVTRCVRQSGKPC